MSSKLSSDLISHWLSSAERDYLLIGFQKDALTLLAASRSFRNKVCFDNNQTFLENRYGSVVLEQLKTSASDQRCLHIRTAHHDLQAWPADGFLVIEETALPNDLDSDEPLNTLRNDTGDHTPTELLIGLNSKGGIQYLAGDTDKLGSLPHDQIIGTQMEAFIHHLDVAHYRNLIQYARLQRRLSHAELRLRGTDGGVQAFQWTAVANDEQVLLIGQTKARDLETALVKSEERLNLILETIEDAFIAVDNSWRLSYVNARGAALLGKPSSSLLGRSLWDCAPSLKNSDAFIEFNRAASTQKPSVFTTRLESDDQWFQVKACPNREGVSIFFTDITSIKLSEERMRHHAMHDTLTGLPNRLSLSYSLQDMIHAGNLPAHKVGLLFIDLDDFKRINDTMGHDRGDELLITIATRLRDTVRQADIVARLSGDEFIIALNNIGNTDVAFSIGRKIVDCISKTPVQLGNDAFYIGASVGVAIYPDDASDVESLMKCADMAMYDAKRAGKNAVRVYQKNMSAELSVRLAIETMLRESFEKDTLLVFYQPRFSATGHIVGMEALARLRQADGLIVSPGEFIPVAEETRLINRLGELVLRKACQDAARWNETYGVKLSVSVNVSGLQLLSPVFFSIVMDALLESNLSPAQLELELTETTLTQTEPTAIAQLKKLKEQGIQISVDDFGTGYSSLSILQQLPVTVLKIDASFTKSVPEDVHAKDLVHGIIAMAHALHLHTVAEGIERPEQRDALVELEVDELQGYLLGKPMPAQELDKLLDAHFAGKQQTLGDAYGKVAHQ